MCSDKILEFGRRNISRSEVEGKDVLEVGSRVVQDRSSTLRHQVTDLGPNRYWGIDIIDGYGVDEICSAEKAVDRFGEDSFDVVIATELLEHVRDWKTVVSVLKRLVRPGGILIVTTRSEGFPYHGWPEDHWRYSVDDFAVIFSDMDVLALEPDPKEPGVFMKARKRAVLVERKPELDLYSIILGRRTGRVPLVRTRLFVTRYRLRYGIPRVLPAPVRVRLKRALGR